MSFLSRWGFGVDLDAEQARGNAADAKLSALNSADYSKGGRIYDEIAAGQGTAAADKDAAAVQAELASGQTGDVAGSVEDAFKVGWGEGEANVLNSVKGTVNTVAGQVFKVGFGALPWWLWLLGIAFVLFYTGIGQAMVRRATSK